MVTLLLNCRKSTSILILIMVRFDDMINFYTVTTYPEFLDTAAGSKKETYLGFRTSMERI